LSYRIAAMGDVRPDGSSGWKPRELQHGVAWLGVPTSERFAADARFRPDRSRQFSGLLSWPGDRGFRYLGTVSADRCTCSSTRRRRSAALPAGAGRRRLAGSTAIDSAPLGTGRQTMLFAVAAVPAGTVKAVELEQRSYRCATM
jgi:hypothetical protein